MKLFLSAAGLLAMIAAPALAEEAVAPVPAPQASEVVVPAVAAPAMSEAQPMAGEEGAAAASKGHGCGSKQTVYLTN